ncbi:MAG: VWA domain-containing protein [Blastocatellia bacterium]|nr:VWA domain-containing protein [Blastocatellia bacterium]
MRTRNEPLTLKRDGQAPVWDDETLHQQLFQEDAELYALTGLAAGIHPWQQARILLTLLKNPWTGQTQASRLVLGRMTSLLAGTLEPETVLTVFLTLRRLRVNYAQVTRTILAWTLNHPGFEDLVVCRRPALADCLEHALGKNTVRGVAKRVATGADFNAWPAEVRRLAKDPTRAALALPFLFRFWDAAPVVRTLHQVAHRLNRQVWQPPFQLPATVTPANRGDISAALGQLYRGGVNQELLETADACVRRAAAGLPRFEGNPVIVLDASASTRGYGDREFCCISQSVAFQSVLEALCPTAKTITVGSQEALPDPQGATDLAGAVLSAFESDPDIVIVITDGYENSDQGDLAGVTKALQNAGFTTPVVFCHSAFSHSDDLGLRRPAPNLPHLTFWHEQEFKSLIETLWALARGPHGRSSLKNHWQHELEQLRKELPLWTWVD